MINYYLIFISINNHLLGDLHQEVGDAVHALAGSVIWKFNCPSPCCDNVVHVVSEKLFLTLTLT